MRSTAVHPSRRDFLRAGAVAAGTLTAGRLPAGPRSRAEHCIFLLLTGGPGQLDTWDPKPDAPAEVRGPLASIPTRIPGVRFAEPFGRMAARADRFAVVRSLCHAEAPIHETGQQLLQTGRQCRGNAEQPNAGAVLTHLFGHSPGGLPGWVLLPGPLGDTGVGVSHGQSAGLLGPGCEAVSPGDSAESDLSHAKERERYGNHRFADDCLRARRMVERGCRFVTVNTFTTVYDTLSWDCHADGGALATTLDDYRTTVGPMFDRAFTALLDDLDERGLLESTLVVAAGEFGRSPRLNARGGRDHWPGVWSALFAGGGVQGGRVVGASDALGAEPRDRPVSPAAVVATIYECLGVDPATRRRFVDAEPICELF
jgi:uncharacterized protein (DUF1501 family)